MIEFALAAERIILLCVGDTREESKGEGKGGKERRKWLAVFLASPCKVQLLRGTKFHVNGTWYL